MKKLFALLLVAGLGISMVGCGSDDTKPKDPVTPPPAKTDGDKPEAPAVPGPTDPAPAADPAADPAKPAEPAAP